MNHQDFLAQQLQALFPMGVSEATFQALTQQPPIVGVALAGAGAPATMTENHQQQQEASFECLPEDEQRTEAIHRVRDAVLQVPCTQKAAYLLALQKSPQLVLDESHPLWFLRRCQLNNLKAAERLCLYWQERVKAFGSEKAFLPLVLHGGGALEAEDVADLHAGYPCLLPDARDGRKVVLYDRHKALPTSSPSSRIRCEFYLQAVLASDEAARKYGVNILDVLIIPRFDKQNLEILDRLAFLAANVFPLDFHMHFLVLPPIPKAGKRYAVQELVADSIETVLKYGDDFSGIHVHVEREKGQILHNLTEDAKLKEEGIPLKLKVGGTWKTQEFLSWCHSREVKEKKQWEASHRGKSPPERKLSENERKDKRRLADILHSRRKRERKKNRIADMHKEHDTLKVKNEELEETHKYLERLLQKAQDIATQVEQGTFTSSDYNHSLEHLPAKKRRKTSAVQAKHAPTKKSRAAVAKYTAKTSRKNAPPAPSLDQKAPPNANLGTAQPTSTQYPQERILLSQVPAHHNMARHQLDQLVAPPVDARTELHGVSVQQHLHHQGFVDQQYQQALVPLGQGQIGFEPSPQASAHLVADPYRTPNDQLLGMIAAALSSQGNINHFQQRSSY